MPSVDPGDTIARLGVDDLARRLLGLAGGRRLTLIGATRAHIAEALAADSASPRGALLLDTVGPRTAPAILDRLLDDLAALALSRWPCWHGGNGPVTAADHACSTLLSAPWLKAASRRAAAGHPPRFRHAARELEFVQLLRAIDPTGVILVAEVDPASAARAAPVIAALEWCAGHGAAVVAALPVPPPATAPYDRILHGAYALAHEPEPALARFIAPPAKAHHASPTERRVEAALRSDPELKDLFCCNATVAVEGWGPHPRVDLLCRAHRIVVELDGPEHRSRAAYANDRDRDYALLVAGYLVLRVTNEQVAADLPCTLEKIRAVVRLRSTLEER